MPKIETSAWQDHAGCASPVFGQSNGPYAEIPLGDVVGLSRFGVHLERLPPGSRSSHRHWHETEDEFVYLISGELVLIEDGETPLQAEDAAGSRADEPTGHCLENRSAAHAVMSVVGSRADTGVVHYPNHDVILRHGNDGAVSRAPTDRPSIAKADGREPVPHPKTRTPASVTIASSG